MGAGLHYRHKAGENWHLVSRGRRRVGGGRIPERCTTGGVQALREERCPVGADPAGPRGHAARPSGPLRRRIRWAAVRISSGGVVSSSTYFRVWDEARRYALTLSQVASPLAGRPYDLRHAAVSLWLNRGVPVPEVAQRAGHSVDVLLKVYAKCIEGDRVKINNVVEDAFAE